MTEKSSADTGMYDREKALISENIYRITSVVEEIRAKHSISRPVTVAAASKTVPSELIRYAHGCGLTCVGENRVQELCAKYAEGAYDGMDLQFIGRLQTNKVKNLIGKVTMIQSLDSLRLAAEIDRCSARAGLITDVLIELNCAGEPDKGGVLPEDIMLFADELDAFPALRLCGIMTIGPVCPVKDDYRKYFTKTYQIFIDISSKKLHNIDKPVLSMGMSDNYDIAVECGATMIRPGSAVFGKRKSAQNTI